MTVTEKLKPLTLLRQASVGRVDRSGSVSVPFIEDKRRRSPSCLTAGKGDLERLEKENERVKIGMRKFRLAIRALQFIFTLLIVALLAQSLSIFTATANSFINSTTRVWPQGIELWPTIIVLTLNVGVMLFILVLIVCHFLKYQVVNPTTGMYTILYIISTSCTMLVMVICAVVLKTQSLSSLPLYQMSCALASMTHRFDHTTICISHNWAFNASIIFIILDTFLLFSVWLLHWRHATHAALQRTRDSIQTRLREFNFDMRSSVRSPTPLSRVKPNAYPGRLWRLEWGEMDYASQPDSTDQRGPISPTTILSPGIPRQVAPVPARTSYIA